MRKNTRPDERMEAPEADVLREQILKLVEQFADAAHAPKPFLPGTTPIPASGKVIQAPEIRSLVDAALDGWLTTGRFNRTFEKNLSEYLSVRYALTTNSGSSANLLAVATLASPQLGEDALRPGDEVITVAAGFPTTVNPLLLYGLVPVFVDVSLPSYNIDPERIEAAVSPNTRAIMLAHTLGNPFDLDRVLEVAKRHHLWVVEDCCDALGSEYTLSSDQKEGRKTTQANAKRVGGFGDIGTLSFYPAHHITMGEGGAVFTRHSKLKRILESIRDWGRDCYCEPGKDNTCGKRFDWQLGDLPYGYDHKYIYSELGYNLKITDMQAACGVAQLKRVPEFIRKRKANFQYLCSRMDGLREFLILPEATPNSDPSWFGFPLTLKENSQFQRRDLLTFLDQKRIGTRLLFGGNLTRQPYLKEQPFRVSGNLHTTDRIMHETFWIGLYPGLNEPMLDYVASQIEQFFRR